MPRRDRPSRPIFYLSIGLGVMLGTGATGLIWVSFGAAAATLVGTSVVIALVISVSAA